MPDAAAHPTVYAALPAQLIAPTAERLAAADLPLHVAPWDAQRRAEAILLLAPHELARQDRDVVLGSTPWAWVHLTSAGTDFIDLGRWSGDTLLTRSWQGYAAPLAEYAVGAILTHEWRDGSPWSAGGAAAGRGLWGSRIGVAGWGAVGQRITQAATALGASVRVFSRTPRRAVARVAHTTSLDDLLDADHLVIALPLTTDTLGLLDDRALSRARPGLHLVNVARAAIVDQDALLAHCAAGRISATLDVSDPEPLPDGHPLRAVASVRCSPHIAWRSRESQYAFVEDFVAIWAALATAAERVPGRAEGTSPARARAAVARATRTRAFRR
jgi:phosphoglycerate dehydrogenase-like enzyme